jgi:hypothetical protein
MSNPARLGVVALALVLAVAAFFVFRPDDTSRRQEAPQTEPAGGEPGAQPPSAPAPQRVERIRIAAGKPVGGARTLSFDSGETVRLAFSADRAAEVHIHGYDRYVDVKAGRTARVRFPAELEGAFEIEDHHTGALLARLEVRP